MYINVSFFSETGPHGNFKASVTVVLQVNCTVCSSTRSAILREAQSHVSTLMRDVDIANLSVCLSVRRSVTFRYCMKTP